MKIKTIKLRFLGNRTGNKADDRFKVDTITDSAEYDPEQLLLRKEVEGLCVAPGWKVTIVESKASA